MTGTASASFITQSGGTMLNNRWHRRMIVGKPVDHVLTIAYIDERICGIASRQAPGSGLLDRIFVRTQVSGRRVLRKCLFAGKRRPVEAIGPEWFLIEPDCIE